MRHRDPKNEIKALQVLISRTADALTYAEIGRRFGFTRQYAQQLYAYADNLLRSQCVTVRVASDLVESMPGDLDIVRLHSSFTTSCARRLLNQMLKQ